ncbi:MAG: glycosyltransferase family 39 protein [Sphingomicrobium sp.]
MGAAIAAFGKTSATLAIVPGIYSAAAIVLFVVLVQRQFGKLAALVAGTLFVATPVIFQSLVRVGVDIAELAFLLAAVFCLQSRVRTGAWLWSLLAGLALGLAILTRATSIVALLPFAVGIRLLPVQRRDWVAFAFGAASVLVAQGFVDVLLTSDAFHHWRLQLGHTRIPSSELPAAAAASGGPLFNPTIIGAWKPSSGISIHWTVDALVNLIANPAIGPTLLFSLLLIVGGRKTLDWKDPPARVMIFMLASAALWFAALVFALAVDPKPRMFTPIVAVACLCVGALGAARMRGKQRLMPVACLLTLTACGVVSANRSVRLEPASELAEKWLADRSRPLAIEDSTAKFLALVPAAASAPIFPRNPATRVLLLGMNSCGEAAAKSKLAGWHVERSAAFRGTQPVGFGSADQSNTRLGEPAVVLCILTPLSR